MTKRNDRNDNDHNDSGSEDHPTMTTQFTRN
jgi:hypothetical protein